ncbi:MAG: RHS repeat domain-containing protein [Salinivirgaceae bacterium]
MAAVHIKENTGSSGIYYIHTDYLGSIMALTNTNGTVVEKYSYDAFGNRRNPLNWSQPDTRTNLMLDRGYTGHEHLDGAHIINMNGRMYDPIVGRMLSPDPILQNPYSTQNYNRYSYVVNNPLKYTDPTGYRMSFQELSYFENQRVQSGGGDYRRYMFGANIDVQDSEGFIMWNSWIDSGVSGLVNFTDYQSGIENGVSFKSYDSGDKDYVVAKYSAIANNGLQGEWIPLMSTDPLEKGYTFLLNGVAANSGGNKYQERMYPFEGFTLAGDPDDDIGSDLTPSQSYSGYLSVKKHSSGFYYVEGFGQVFPGNDGPYGNKVAGNIRVFQNGNEVGYRMLNMDKEWGPHFYNADWQQLGYSRLVLPNTGDVRANITIYSYNNRWWGGSTSHILYQGNIDF